MGEQEKLLRELDMLLKEHKELDVTIQDLSRETVVDQLRIQRLKKRKLWLKDRIAQVQSLIHPDIIA